MNLNTIENLLMAFKKGEVSLENTLEILKSRGMADIGFAKIDIERMYRTGAPEVVFCESKSIDSVVKIAETLYKKNNMAILTRLTDEQIQNLKKSFKHIKIFNEARIALIGSLPEGVGLVSVLSGGTSDQPIAEEAAVTAEILGARVKRFYDVGVAGIHRLLRFHNEIKDSNVIIAVAGMEGALPSVVGGLFNAPVIGVPTSIGYGTNFGGVAPLLSMLNSCSPGVAVVNIDNGFGAGYIASMINKKIEDAKKDESTLL